MPAPTVEVTITLDDGNGTAYEGVVVTARLDQNDVYTAGDESFVISTPVTGTTDANGTVVLDLFPNHPTDGLGTTGSTWYFSARPPGASGWHYAAQIPNVACNLADLTNEPAPSNPQSFAASVRTVLLTGLSTATNAVAAASDTVLQAIGKLQAQISGFLTATVVAPTSSSTVLGETGGVVKRFLFAFLSPLVGAVARTFTSKLADTVSVKDFGATGDGVTDDSAYVTSALAALPSGGTLDFPYTSAGYVFDLTITKPCTIRCNWNTFKPATAGSGIICGAGTLSATGYILNATHAEGALTLNLTAAPADIAAGNLIQITDDTARPSDSAKINFEVHKVKSVGATSVTLEDPLRYPKAASATWNVKKITPISGVRIENISVQDTDAAHTNYGVMLQYFADITIRGVRGVNMVGPVVELQACYDWSVEDMECSEPLAVGSGQGYGLSMVYGSRHGRVRRLRGDGMRHLFDVGSAWDIDADDVIARNGTAVDFVLAHNSIGGHIKLRGESHDAVGSGRRALAALNQGVYTTATTQYNAFIPGLDIDVKIFSQDRGANQVGAYFEIPVRDSKIRVNGVCGDGAGGAVSANTQLVRFQPVNNRNVEVWVDSVGYDLPVVLTAFDATAKAPDDHFEAVKVRKLYAKNAHYPFSESEAGAIHIDELEVDTLMAAAGRGIFSNSNATVKLRSIKLGLIRWRDATGRITDLANADLHANGALGSLGSVERESNTETPYALADGFTLYPYDIIEYSKDGVTLSVDPGANVTSASTAFQAGLWEGQRVRLVNVGTFDVVVQHTGVLVYNNGASSVTLNSTKRAAEWTWANNAWWQVL